MQPSRHNILSQIPGTDTWCLANLLSGEADLLESHEAEAFQRGAPLDPGQFAAKGYLVEPEEEERRYRRAWLDFAQARDQDEVQLFFVPDQACNFDCDYCFQEGYERPSAEAFDEVAAAFFAWIDARFAGRRRYLTLFGGEPLLPSPAARRRIETLVRGAADRELDIAVVTNGYTIKEYLPLLMQARVREVQITLDGPPEVHDRRRPLKGGGATFERVAAGVDATLAAGLPVNLRVVLDRDNLPHLPALARIAVERGWTDHPSFKTQLGRNYELHTCQVDQSRLYSRIELAAALHALATKHPDVLRFHKPAFSISRFLFEQGRLPDPLFDACPGTKTEWAFDATGRIYACTATVGKTGEVLGRFWPQVALDEARIERWQDRDVMAIEGCRNCPVQLACGGGCAAVAFNRTGDLHQTDCRPVAELLGLGASLYGGLAPQGEPRAGAGCCG